MSDVKPLHKVGVSVLLTNKDGQILLGRRTGTTASGQLSTPGGRLEIEEGFLDCALREFEEETGAQLDPAFAHVFEYRKHHRFGGHYIMFYVHATQYSGTIRNTEPDKCEEWRWYPLATVLGLPIGQCTEPTSILAEVGHRHNLMVSCRFWKPEPQYK